MVESLVGLITFSLILMLYLPAYLSEVFRINDLANQTYQYRKFYELISIYYSNEVDQLPVTFSIDEEGIEYFSCSVTVCEILFSDGARYVIEVVTDE